MARNNVFIDTDVLRAGIELYTGIPVKELKRYDDPVVAGAIALRAVFETYSVDFFISANQPAMTDAASVDVALQECNFDVWPPSTGFLRFI